MRIDQRRILRPFDQICTTLSLPPGNPTPEQVHKLRIRLRRVDAALDGLGLDTHKNGRRALRHAKSLRRRTGKIQDMDVLTGLASSLDLRDCAACRVELLEYIGAERYRQARKLRDSAHKNWHALGKELHRCAARIEKRIGTRAPARAKVLAVATITARIFELGSELARYPRLTRSNLHKFRVRAKHLRYMLKIANECDTPFFLALDEVKDKIGEWHDWERLTDIARSLDGRPTRRALLSEMKEITDKKFEHALEVAQRFRDQHLASLFPPKRSIPAKFNLESGSRTRLAA